MAIYSTQSQKTEENERNIILSKGKLSSPAKYFSTSKTLNDVKTSKRVALKSSEWLVLFALEP